MTKRESELKDLASTAAPRSVLKVASELAPDFGDFDVVGSVQEMYEIDPRVGQRYWNMVLLALDKDRYDPLVYTNMVKFLAKGSKPRKRVLIDGVLARLLDEEYAHYIYYYLPNDVFQHHVYENNLPPFSWTELSGKEMIGALVTGNRKISYVNGRKMASQLGREDAQGGYPNEYPTCYIDLGSGDGRKGLDRVRPVVQSGRSVTLVEVDCSQDAINESSEYANNELANMKKGGELDSNGEPRLRVIPIKDRFENLSRNGEFQRILSGHPNRVFMFYGTTAANYDPPQAVQIIDTITSPGDRVEVGLQLYSEDDEQILRTYGSKTAKAVSSIGLRAMGYSREKISSMKFGAVIEKMQTEYYDELQHFNMGMLTVVKTFFEARKPTDQGLIYLRPGERLCATASYKYLDQQVRRVFGYKRKFRILDKLQEDFDAIYPMVK